LVVARLSLLLLLLLLLCCLLFELHVCLHPVASVLSFPRAQRVLLLIVSAVAALVCPCMPLVFVKPWNPLLDGEGWCQSCR
jgi:hypothetical protein